MNVMGKIATGLGVVGGMGAIGTAGYVTQQWQSGNVLADQMKTDRRAARQMEAGNPDEAKYILDNDRPSNRERNWDKLGVITGASTVVGGAGLLKYVGDSMLHEPPISTRSGKVGGLLALAGFAATAGAATGVANNMFSDRFE